MKFTIWNKIDFALNVIVLAAIFGFCFGAEGPPGRDRHHLRLVAWVLRSAEHSASMPQSASYRLHGEDLCRAVRCRKLLWSISHRS